MSIRDSLSNDQTRERIIVKLNINDPRLSIIKDLKIKMCKVLKIEPCVLQIMEVKEGCVQVTFLIPSHISKLLFIKSLTKVQYDHFKALSVLSLTCAHFQEVFLVREYWFVCYKHMCMKWPSCYSILTNYMHTCESIYSICSGSR